MTRHVSEHQMRWADLDTYGHVNNVVFLRYLQEARVDMLFGHAAAHGAEQLAAGIVIASNEVQYLRPLSLSARPVVVHTWVTSVGGARFGLGYEVRDPDRPDLVCARAATTATPYDVDAGRARRLLPQERTVLERALHPELPLPDARDPQPSAGVPGPVRRYDCAVRFDDLDLYGHVNNVTYFEYLQEARVWCWPADSGVDVVLHQQVTHRRPVALGSGPVRVQSRLVGLGARTWVLEYVVRAGEEVVATARSTQVAYDLDAGRSREITGVERDLLVGAS